MAVRSVKAEMERLATSGTATVMDDVKQTFFGGSAASLVSFFARRESLSEAEISELRKIIDSLDSRNSV